MTSTHQGEANRPPEPPVGHDELLVPADWVDVLPHQVHHRGQREDGDEPWRSFKNFKTKKDERNLTAI